MSPDAESREPSLLPVEWSSPWQRLRRDLARDVPAVIAAARLRLQELWRRNQGGELSVPGFWPDSVGALFWPLILLLLLALPLTLVVIGSRPPSPAAPAMAPPSPAASLEQQLEQAMEPQLLREPPSPVIPLAPDVEPTAVSAQPQPSAVLVEPLLELLKLDHSDDLVDRLRPRADQGLMELIPSKTFSALSMAERQQQADVWLAQLQDDGYERLVLLDEQGRLLGRSARIGGGMILWSTPQ